MDLDTPIVIFVVDLNKGKEPKWCWNKNTIKAWWPEPSQGKQKREGQKKAKRHTTHKNQTKGKI
jgi:hypothetical protein